MLIFTFRKYRIVDLIKWSFLLIASHINYASFFYKLGCML